jgi:hypothetical protein
MRIPALLTLAMLALTACKPSLLPGTRVEDTPDNREVVKFLGEYKKAIESRSADQLMALVSDDYFEDNGTVDQTDDYGVEKLRARLSEHMGHTKQIYLEVQVQHIAVDDAGVVNVDYHFNQRALIALDSGEKWVSFSDVNRLVLRKTGEEVEDGLVIVSGL